MVSSLGFTASRPFADILAHRPAKALCQGSIRRSLFEALWVQVPLAGAEQTMQQYKAWEPEPAKLPASLDKAHKAALQMLAVRAASEESVAADKPADATLLAGYMAYIKLEEARPSPDFDRAGQDIRHRLAQMLSRASERTVHDSQVLAVSRAGSRIAMSLLWDGCCVQSHTRTSQATRRSCTGGQQAGLHHMHAWSGRPPCLTPGALCLTKP